MGCGHLRKRFCHGRPVLLDLRLQVFAVAEIGHEGRDEDDAEYQQGEQENELEANIKSGKGHH